MGRCIGSPPRRVCVQPLTVCYEKAQKSEVITYSMLGWRAFQEAGVARSREASALTWGFK
eukprot:1767370-Amphidinium_carterae.1